MTTTGFSGWTIEAYGQAYRARTVSPSEVARWAIAEADRINATYGTAVTHISAEETMSMAQASEQRWFRGEPTGPLDGIPATIKNLLAVRGWPLDFCSRTVDPGTRAAHDAPAVARLREAGAVFLGYTAAPEFSWKLVTDSPKYGVLSNPHDRTRTPGGSSGGAAVCAAVGLAPINLATDAAGSIRVPASFCGVFGMKPTFGTVAAYPASSLTHVGPISRSVTDAAITLDTIGAPDRRDWYNTPLTGLRPFSRHLSTSLRGMRVAYAHHFAGMNPSPDIAAAAFRAARQLEELGARIEERNPQIADPKECGRILFTGGYVSRFRDMPKASRALADPGLVATAGAAEGLTADDVRRALDQRYRLGCDLSMFFEDFDLLLTPTTIRPAFELGRNMPNGFGDEITSWSGYTYPFNLSHNPAASVPYGRTSCGLPIGIQIIGPKFGDAKVLSACAHLAQT